MATFSVSAIADHQRATIPFADTFLLPSAKRTQFERWRGALAEYVARRPTRWPHGPSSCSVEGCDGPVRGRGLCRKHYYRATGY